MQFRKYGFVLMSFIFAVHGTLYAADSQNNEIESHVRTAARYLLEVYKNSSDFGILTYFIRVLRDMALNELEVEMPEGPLRGRSQIKRLEDMVFALSSVRIVQDGSESSIQKSSSEVFDDVLSVSTGMDDGKEEADVLGGSFCYASILRWMEEQVTADRQVLASREYAQLNKAQKLSMLLELFVQYESRAIQAQDSYIQAAAGLGLLSCSPTQASGQFRLGLQLGGTSLAQTALRACLKKETTDDLLPTTPTAQGPLRLLKRRASLPTNIHRVASGRSSGLSGQESNCASFQSQQVRGRTQRAVQSEAKSDRG